MIKFRVKWKQGTYYENIDWYDTLDKDEVFEAVSLEALQERLLYEIGGEVDAIYQLSETLVFGSEVADG